MTKHLAAQIGLGILIGWLLGVAILYISLDLEFIKDTTYVVT